ncbi:MFS transporter [Leptolyngbya sp. 7M]|uniref:MFS transporter n=1 Tax=Leptolyngbya sp. 7M TaxID=2812896 RepID=UPI001B8B35AA|nr:MFS transporter [Leptolyngbya sp. 7M]QYO63725.1 MFS transporter [Leptolyngbya sp. 7M]
MRTFIILWLGQLASSIGSSMTHFALTLWVWQQTESATAIALILVSYQLPQMAVSLFAGLLVDRVSRKRLLILSDTISACCTGSVGILSFFQVLQLWHIFLIAAIIGCFGSIQSLSYSTIVPLLVPKQHHTRAISMGAMVGHGAGILAPALAGVLYPLSGLFGITLIDLGPFAIAVFSLLLVPVPQPPASDRLEEPEGFATATGVQPIWQEALFGFRYIASRPSLWTMVVALSAFAFLNQIGETL